MSNSKNARNLLKPKRQRHENLKSFTAGARTLMDGNVTFNEGDETSASSGNQVNNADQAALLCQSFAHVPTTDLPNNPLLTFDYFDRLRFCRHKNLFKPPGASGAPVPNTNNHNDLDNIKSIAFMVPLSPHLDPKPNHHDFVRAALWSAYDFNSRFSSSLNCRQNITLLVDILDTQSQPILATRELWKAMTFHPKTKLGEQQQQETQLRQLQQNEFLFSSNGYQAIVGPADSRVAWNVAQLNQNLWQLPHISYGSRSIRLDYNATQPPPPNINHQHSSFSLNEESLSSSSFSPPARFQDDNANSCFGKVVSSQESDLYVSLLWFQQQLDATHIGILYPPQTIQLHSQFQNFAQQFNLTTVILPFDSRTQTRQKSAKNIESFGKLKASKIRYLIAMVDLLDMEGFLTRAKEFNLWGPEYVWLLVNENDCADQADLQLRDPALQEVANGMAVLRRHQNRELPLVEYQNRWERLRVSSDFQEYVAMKMPPSLERLSVQSSVWTQSLAEVYDSVWAMGLSICQSPSPNKTMDTFRELSFSGASGQVQIDPTTSSRTLNTTTYSIDNIVVARQGTPNVTTAVMGELQSFSTHILFSSGNATWSTTGRPFQYSSGELVPPPNVPPIEQDLNIIPYWIIGLGYSGGAIVMLSAIWFALWIYLRRKSRVVSGSQPQFLTLICLGVLSMAISIIPLGSQEPPFPLGVMDAMCMMGYWTFGLGFSLCFVALYSKLRRINKIVNNARFRRIVVKPQDVLLPGSILFTLTLTLLIAWQIVAPIKYARVIRENGLRDEFGRLIQSDGFCVAPDNDLLLSNIFLAALALCVIISLVIANIEAFKARRITTEFSESVYIGYAMACLLQGIIIGTPLIFISDSPHAGFIFKCIIVLMTSSAILYLIFIPKVSIYREYEKERLALRRARALRASMVFRMNQEYNEQQQREPEPVPLDTTSSSTHRGLLIHRNVVRRRSQDLDTEDGVLAISRIERATRSASGFIGSDRESHQSIYESLGASVVELPLHNEDEEEGEDNDGELGAKKISQRSLKSSARSLQESNDMESHAALSRSLRWPRKEKQQPKKTKENSSANRPRFNSFQFGRQQQDGGLAGRSAHSFFGAWKQSRRRRRNASDNHDIERYDDGDEYSIDDEASFGVGSAEYDAKSRRKLQLDACEHDHQRGDQDDDNKNKKRRISWKCSQKDDKDESITFQDSESFRVTSGHCASQQDEDDEVKGNCSILTMTHDYVEEDSTTVACDKAQPSKQNDESDDKSLDDRIQQNRSAHSNCEILVDEGTKNDDAAQIMHPQLENMYHVNVEGDDEHANESISSCSSSSSGFDLADMLNNDSTSIEESTRPQHQNSSGEE